MPWIVESACAMRCSCRVAAPVHMTVRPEACSGSGFAVFTCAARGTVFTPTARTRQHADNPSFTHVTSLAAHDMPQT